LLIKKLLGLFSSIKLLFITLSLIFVSLVIGILSNFLHVNNSFKTIIDTIGFDRVYYAWWFKSLLFLLVINTFACSLIRLISFIKLLRKPEILDEEKISKLAHFVTIENKNVETEEIEKVLRENRYTIINKTNFGNDKNVIYGRKGTLGKIGFFLLHLSVILIMFFFAISSFMEKSFIIDLSLGQQFKIPYLDYSLKFQDILQGVNESKVAKVEILEKGKGLSQVKILPFKNFRVNSSCSIYCLDVNTGVETSIEKLNSGNNSYILMEGDYVFLENDKVLVLKEIDLDNGIKKGFLTLALNDKGSLDYEKKINLGEPLLLDDYLINFKNILGNVRLRITYNPVTLYIFASFMMLIFGLSLSLYVPFNEIYVIIQNNRVVVGGRTNKMEEKFEKEIKNIKLKIERGVNDS